MGNELIERVIAVLQAADIRAAAAWPGQKLPAITGPVAAVSLHYADWSKMEAAVLVEIRSPVSMGGERCQNEGIRAGDALTEMGAVCKQENCEFDGSTGQFCVQLLGVFAQPQTEPEQPGFYLFLNQERLLYAVAFTAEQVKDAETGALTPKWAFQLEELLPENGGWGMEAEADFTMSVSRNGTWEQFGHCSWTGCKRRVEDKGYTLIRTGIADARYV